MRPELFRLLDIPFPAYFVLLVSGFLFVMPEVADVPIANLTGHHLVGAHFIAAAAAIVAFLLQRAKPAARAA